MKGLKYILLFAVALCASCSGDDDLIISQPSDIGVFVDSRDGKEYHYATYGRLQWSVENLAYNLGDMDKCYAYQPVYAENEYTTELVGRYGYLYTYSGALAAVPEGWRLPTDEEWSELEKSHGFLSEAFGLLYGGYYTKNTIAATPGSRFMASWAYFWTSTQDKGKPGNYYFFRKKFYSHDYMTRESMETDANFLSVRFVRTAR